MKKFWLALLTLIATYQLQAQFSITGKVTDSAGLPLIGVNVSEQATGRGTVTDVDGAYALEVSSKDAVIEFSYVGYMTMEVKVDGRDQIFIMMEEGINLGEVQIVGTRSYKRS